MYFRNRFNNLITTKDKFKSSEKKKKLKSYDKSNESANSNKIRLVDIYYYDRKKWEDRNQPMQEKTLQKILVRKSTISYLNDMLGEWGSKGKKK